MYQSSEEYMVKVLVAPGDERIISRKKYGQLHQHVEFIENIYPGKSRAEVQGDELDEFEKAFASYETPLPFKTKAKVKAKPKGKTKTSKKED